MLLKDYLAVNNSPTTQAPATVPVTYVTSTNDLSHFFSRAGRRPERIIKGNLFSFESSLTGEFICCLFTVCLMISFRKFVNLKCNLKNNYIQLILT